MFLKMFLLSSEIFFKIKPYFLDARNGLMVAILAALSKKLSVILAFFYRPIFKKGRYSYWKNNS
jgi:uncharacterized protein YlaN (UPF0358 family)